MSSSVQFGRAIISHFRATFYGFNLQRTNKRTRWVRNKRRSGAHKVPTDSLYSLAESIFVDKNAMTAANSFICPARIGARGLPADPCVAFVQYTLRLAMNEEWTGIDDDRLVTCMFRLKMAIDSCQVHTTSLQNSRRSVFRPTLAACRARVCVCLSIFFESVIFRSDVISARIHAVIRFELKTLLYFIYRTQRAGMWREREKKSVGQKGILSGGDSILETEARLYTLAHSAHKQIGI